MARITYMTNTATSISTARSETVLRKVSASPCSVPTMPWQNLLRSLFHELGCRPNGVSRLQIEEHGHAGELIDVVDRLRTDDRMPARDRVQRNHALSVVALDVELSQVFRSGTLVIRDFKDHLILVGRLLDQVAVILRIGV